MVPGSRKCGAPRARLAADGGRPRERPSSPGAVVTTPNRPFCRLEQVEGSPGRRRGKAVGARGRTAHAGRGRPVVHSTDSTLVLRRRRLGPRDGDPILVGVGQHVSVGDGVNRYQTCPACSCPFGNWLWNRASSARFRLSSRAPAKRGRGRARGGTGPDRHGGKSPTKVLDLGYAGEGKESSSCLLCGDRSGSRSQLESRPSNPRGKRVDGVLRVPTAHRVTEYTCGAALALS